MEQWSVSLADYYNLYLFWFLIDASYSWPSARLRKEVLQMKFIGFALSHLDVVESPEYNLLVVVDGPDITIISWSTATI